MPTKQEIYEVMRSQIKSRKRDANPNKAPAKPSDTDLFAGWIAKLKSKQRQ